MTARVQCHDHDVYCGNHRRGMHIIRNGRCVGRITPAGVGRVCHRLVRVGGWPSAARGDTPNCNPATQPHNLPGTYRGYQESACQAHLGRRGMHGAGSAARQARTGPVLPRSLRSPRHRGPETPGNTTTHCWGLMEPRRPSATSQSSRDCDLPTTCLRRRVFS